MQHFQLLVQLIFPTLFSIRVPVLFMSSPSSTESLCFIKPTHLFSDGLRNGQLLYLANERWGEVSWRVLGEKSNCYKVTYRHLGNMLYQHVTARTSAVTLSPWGSRSKTKPICWGLQRGKIRATLVLEDVVALTNNHPETASCQESWSEKTTHVPLKTVQPGFPVTHS